MRKTLAVVALAGAALGFSAPGASAGCYGVQGRATACYSGNLGVTRDYYDVCVYTGGDTCDTYQVPIVGVETPYDVQVCTNKVCTA